MSAGFKRAIIALMLLVASATATSGATYTAHSDNEQSFTAAADFGVHVSVDDPGSPLRQTVTVGATASETAGGAITQVTIQRSPAGAGTWTTICTDTGAPYSCAWDTTGVANGQYDLRARATNNNGYSRTSPVVSDRLVDNASPSVTMADPGAWFGGTITLATTAVSDTGGSGLANVRYEYKLSAAGTWSTACTASSSPWECSFDTTSLTGGQSYDFRAVAQDGAGNETTSVAVVDRRADGVAPSGTLTAPGAYLRGSVSLTGTASDGESGVASVTIERSAAGAGSWSNACVDTAAPFTSCGWDTTAVADGLYDLRARVVDVAGNTFTTATATNHRVDNTVPFTALTDPGSPLSGTVNLGASGSDPAPASGVANVSFQRSAAGAGSWSDLCAPDTTSAYTCAWNSATVSDGLYDFRSVATDNAGNTFSSAPVVNARVDNFVPTAADVQTANGGATAGVIEAGDTMTLTFSEQIDPSSVIAGWDGTGSQNIYLAFSNHNGQGDRVMFHNSVSPYAELSLAASPGVRLNADYVPSSGATLAGTLARNGPSFTITLGTLVGGSVNGSAPGAATMTWSPTSGCSDFVGKACSTTQRSETGAADAEF